MHRSGRAGRKYTTKLSPCPHHVNSNPPHLPSRPQLLTLTYDLNEPQPQQFQSPSTVVPENRVRTEQGVLLVALASPPVMPLALVAIVLRVVWQTVSFAAKTALR